MHFVKSRIFISCVILSSLAFFKGTQCRTQTKKKSDIAVGGGSSHIFQQCKSGNVATITFDDSQGGNDQITRALAAHKVRAVFHVTSATLTVSGKEQVFKNLINMGHEVGLQIINVETTTPYKNVIEKVKAGIEIFKDTIARSPRFIRFPYGFNNSQVIDAVTKLGLIVTTTSVDSADYSATSPAEIQRKVKISALEMKSNERGPIIVFRDTTTHGPAAVDGVIAQLKKMDYEVASLAKCIGISESSKSPVKNIAGGGSPQGNSPKENNKGNKKNAKGKKQVSQDPYPSTETSGAISSFSKIFSSLTVGFGILAMIYLF